ncbi:MAG: DNRLRE domain-containing protein [Verrucomicrobia bacterium]|nr:DNRLRE domain-containing protein [Verrucomicrobiota bacterium]
MSARNDGRCTLMWIVLGLGPLAVQSEAAPVDSQKAAKAAETFIVRAYPAPDPRAVRNVTPFGKSHLKLERVEPLLEGGKRIGFVAHLKPSGYVLLSSDDEAPPVKLHTDNGDFNKLPPEFFKVIKSELSEDLSALADMKKLNKAANPKHGKLWQALTDAANNPAELAAVTVSSPSTVLLTTTWDQNAPYNYYSPAASGGRPELDGRAWAGCTACAVAQILRYRSQPNAVAQDYSYPDNDGSCTGTHSISDAGLGAYDWANMPNSINTGSPAAQIHAIGQLMYHAGVALDQNYEASETSAFPSDVPSVFRTYFGYTAGSLESKSSHTSSEWYDMIAADIDADKPVFYAMWQTDGSGGHAVVCDGYQNGNEIHLNLGWSGSGNTWYNIDTVIETVSVNGHTWTIHRAVFGITPVLRSQSVTPSSGTTADSYTYSVQYTDVSGNAPLEAKVYVDDTPYNMTSGSGSIATGRTYTLAKSGLTAGVHSFYFSFRTAAGNSVSLPFPTGTFAGPTVSSGGNPEGRVKISTYWGGDGSWEGWLGGIVDPKEDYTKRYMPNEQHWFTAYPDFGWMVDAWRICYDWSSGHADYHAPDAVNGNSAMMITRDVYRDANNWAENAIWCRFKRIHEDQRILTISTTGPGAVSPAAGQYEYPLSAQVATTATPLGDASFVKWLLDGVQVSTNLSYTVSMASQDHSLQAVFQYKQTATYTNDLPCIEDATIRLEDPADNWGDNQDVNRVGRKLPKNYTRKVTHESLLKFDVSSVPSDAIVQSVVLWLWNGSLPYYDGVGYEVQKNTEDWHEETITSGNPACANRFNYNGDCFNGGEYSWHQIDIPSKYPDSMNWIMRDWKTANYGLRVTGNQQYLADPKHDYAPTNSSYNGDYRFANRHGDPSKAPFLRVVYQGRRLVPSIFVNPTNITVQAVKGEAGTNVTLNIQNNGEGTLSYAVTASTNWMVLSGDTTATVTSQTRQVSLAFNVTNLSVGYYSGTISPFVSPYERL